MKNLSKKFRKIPEIEKNKTIPFASAAEFSMHELLEFLLQKTGPATVRVSTFSISEIAIRSFFNLMEQGTIYRLECLFDLSVKRHKLGLLYFVNNIASSIAISKNHAKFILIENADWAIVVVGTANFQVNDKNEVGIISTEPGFYKFYSDIFADWFLKGILITQDEFN